MFIGLLLRKSFVVFDLGLVRIKENCCYGYDVVDVFFVGSGFGCFVGCGFVGFV